ncbi:hypothetical protein LTR10_020128 [Elasticomyces elasticus]|uniref:Uncharacterized protein n=1 Tax=Exophiala sideris TaxID=1016849 RepID=A0ABR0IW90_9EURO|nr:hypothetical protein LTR10_020128 [Elasticomyces elasticus]KAK5021589.1 hypothetical protein LTS07_010886 [Exophiala sideris]KAK5049726.1 hypothetical protein LTR69_010910 [Exophiala sideris]KAK5176707.1 hypothetical protein LTR44_010777 [Eurotiomycetes sp. CCFEE 6388]
MIILITAFCVKLRNWRRDMKLEMVTAEEQLERGETTLASRLSEDIPFGIRALTEDAEVEGLWNSRAVTSLHHNFIQPRRSSTSLRRSSQPRKDSLISSTSLHRPVHPGPLTPNALQPPMHSCGQGRPVHEVPVSRKTPKKIVINYGGPYLQSEATKLISDRGSSTTQARLNNAAIKIQLRPSTDRTSVGQRKFVIGNRQKSTSLLSRRETVSDDPLERMEAHRRFHAAESGQLRPRSRRHTDLALTTALAPSPSDSSDSDASSAHALSWPRDTGVVNLGQRVHGREQRIEGPKPVPFRAFVESLPTTKAPPSAWTDKTQARVHAKLPAPSKGSDTSSRVSMHTSESSISSTTTAPTLATESVSITNTRSRKINNGFELLPAGALIKEPSVKEFGLWPEPRVAERKPKKLQKRPPSTSASRRSSSDSGRFSGESFRLPVF